MDRSAAADYLADEFSTGLTKCGITATDDPGGLKTVIDAAFRSVGVARSDLPTASINDDDAELIELYLGHFMTARFHRHAVHMVTVSLDGPQMTKQWSDWAKALATELERTEKAISDANSWSTGVIVLDYLEPVTT